MYNIDSCKCKSSLSCEVKILFSQITNNYVEVQFVFYVLMPNLQHKMYKVSRASTFSFSQ